AIKSFFFWCALFVLPAFVILRLVAARIYASGLILLVQSGRITFADLAAKERTVFERLGLLTTQPEPELHPVIRAGAWTGTRVGRVCGRGLLIALWFSSSDLYFRVPELSFRSCLAQSTTGAASLVPVLAAVIEKPDGRPGRRASADFAGNVGTIY